jgi:hypothetical protein
MEPVTAQVMMTLRGMLGPPQELFA